MDRKSKVIIILLAGFMLFCGSCMGLREMISEGDSGKDVYEGWRLGMQAYTFNRFTFYEAVDKTASLGLGWVEAYPGQRFSKGWPTEKFHHTMSAGLREAAKAKLEAAGVKLVNYGVVGLPNDEAKCREVFDFAKEMGIETIVSEPKAEALDLIDRLCQEYEINVAIHNHPTPSPYWNPQTVLEACRGRSGRIGACADTGHWMRSGINPLDGLRKLEGRIISLHLKDLNEFGNRDAHDVIWGTGLGDVKAMLEELNRQNFKGVFSIEYEHNWENSVPEIRGCVGYFNSVAGKLKPAKWNNLLTENLSNFIYKPGTWAMEDGVLAYIGGGDIWTRGSFENFVLDLEFKLAENTNSGVFLRNIDNLNWRHHGMEIQVFDSCGDEASKHSCGAVYDCIAPSKNMARKPGKWNRYIITCVDNKVNVVLNGKEIIDMDLNDWDEVGWSPDGTKNKFPVALKSLQRPGYIGFQDHGTAVWYRNIRVKRLH